MGRSTVSSAISSRERRPAPTSVRDDEGRALSRSEAKSCSGELRPRGSRDASAPLARSRGAPLDRAAELFLGQREARSETDSGSNLSVRARARAATRPVFGADTPPLAQTVRMMLGPAEVDLGFNLEVERQVLVARASAFLSPTMCPRPETRLSGSADALPTLAQARFVAVESLYASYARYSWLAACACYYSYDILSPPHARAARLARLRDDGRGRVVRAARLPLARDALLLRRTRVVRELDADAAWPWGSGSDRRWPCGSPRAPPL